MLQCTIASVAIGDDSVGVTMRLIEQLLTLIGGGARAWPPRRLSLALQGGGSFGAFTAGVLDRLLDEPDIGNDTMG